MTGNEILRQAMTLLNYTDTDGAITADADLQKRALPLINQIYSDLWYIRTSSTFRPLTRLADAIDLDHFVLRNVMPYGVAMLIAQTDGDIDNQTMYASLYNQRRSSVRSCSDRMIDCQPKVLF